MITIGVDAHKRVHQAVAVDDAGVEVGQWRGANTAAGWQSLERWAADVGPQHQWGIEGAWGYGRGLAQQLVASGAVVFEINTRWTALARKSARKPDKTDGLDALAVAQFVRQEPAGLPRVHADDECAVLDLMATEREGALTDASRIRNQIHALLTQLDPEYKDRLPRLDSRAGLKAIVMYKPRVASELQDQRAAAVRRLGERLRLTLAQVDDLGRQIEQRAAQSFAPLTRLCGISLLTAGTLAGILGPGRRFGSDAKLAAYAGVAPLEASSAGLVRHRLNRGGNRRLNAALYRIALTQAHHSPEARAYLARRVSEGKSKREAIRALKRYLIRAIWRLWQECVPIRLRDASLAAA